MLIFAFFSIFSFLVFLRYNPPFLFDSPKESFLSSIMQAININLPSANET